ncbi:hypothetical protein ABXX25_002754 [Salmonella enterica]|nr:hypothetical protein [Salmonella enterica]
MTEYTHHQGCLDKLTHPGNDNVHYFSGKEREHVNGELSVIGNHSAEAHEAARCLAIARTKMQEACMWACRAVAPADADC